VIPLDHEGRFYIDWGLSPFDERLTKDSFEHVLLLDLLREQGYTNEIPRLFQNKLVVVGSLATGNDIADLVATPLGKKTSGVSQHWNVANAIITGRFIRPYSHLLELCLIVLLGATSALLTWNLRVLSASFWVGTLVVVYLGLATFLFAQYRVWIPLVLPMLGALVTTVCMVTYQAFFEQKERRRVKSVFAKLVSPNVVNELLKSEHLSLGGARCEVSVYFADVRGFTELTDRSHARAEAYVREHQLTGASAKAYYDQQAQDVLQTVNLYLGAIADMVKKHNGTLDKYIGDCVMAFWGAPTPTKQHALFCVRAAIDAQRAIADLNRQRFAENERREAENAARADQGQPPLQLLPLLSLGTGINTGIVTVGLMGSDAHILNYTVFGRDVNLASRLEGVSGRGRIIISEATYAEFLPDDPTLAAICVSQPPVTVKGIHEAVKIYEVPWKLAEPTPVPAPAPASPSPSSIHTA
jgi:adenylate cyclase